MGLSEDQARSFGKFLSEDPEPGAQLEVQDLEVEGAQVEAIWNPAGTKLTITLKPATPWWKGALPQAVLMGDEVATLGRFLVSGSPGPA
jgi:hypothetical protein